MTPETDRGRTDFVVISGPRRLQLEEQDGSFAIIMPSELTYNAFLIFVERELGLETATGGLIWNCGYLSDDLALRVLRRDLATGTCGPWYALIHFHGPIVVTWEIEAEDAMLSQVGYGFTVFDEAKVREVLTYMGTTETAVHVERLLGEIESFVTPRAQ